MVAVIARLQERIHYSIARAKYRRAYISNLCHRHTSFAITSTNDLMLTKKWVVLLILFHKGKAMIISTNIFTSLAKSPF